MLNSRQLNLLTQRIIGCAIAVHKSLGPGLLESLYEEALCFEFDHQGIVYRRQVPVYLCYRERKLTVPLWLDLLVADEIIIEAKSVESIHPVYEAQLLSYLRLARKDVGLLINFNVALLKDGIRRKIRRYVEE